MSVLDEYFKIFEGPGDADFRKRAQDAFKATQDALRRAGPAKVTVSRSKVPVASVDIGGLLLDPELKGLRLEFVPARGDLDGAFVPASQTIRLYPNVQKLFQTDPSSLDPDAWKSIVGKHGADIVGRMEQPFVHEFIHYMDWKRIHPSDAEKRSKVFNSVPSSKKSGAKAYVNNPLELNAHIQAGLSKIETYLDGKPVETIKKTVGTSADDFYKKLTKALGPRFVTNLDDKNIAKLKKRAAQFYQDITTNSQEKR